MIPGDVFNSLLLDGGRGLDIRVDIAPGADPTADPGTWTWIDVTRPYCLGRNRIVITRGRRDEQGQVGPSQATVAVRNPHGEWLEDNPFGPWYPDLIIGTPLRVRVIIAAVSYTRFTGFIFELPPRYEEGLADQFVSIVANGVLLRPGQGSVPAAPAAASVATTNPDLLAFWPCTDAAGSAQAVATTGGINLTRNSHVTFAEVVGPDGAAKLPDLYAGGVLSGNVPTTAVNTAWAVACSVQADDAATGFIYPIGWHVTAGTTREWLLEYKNDGTTNVLWLDADGNVAAAVTTSVDYRDGLWHRLSVHAAQSGANIAVTLYVDGVSAGTGSVTTQTLAAVSAVYVGDSTANVGCRSAGQVGVYTSAAALSATETAAASGLALESTLDRFARLCTTAGVAYEVAGTEAIAMGVQSDADFVAQLRECETAEAGTLLETREGRLRLDGRSVRENATAAFTFDVQNDLADIQPTNDVRLMTNDFTAERTGGGSGHYADAAHVAKYGLYEKSATFNVASDTQLADEASWRVGLGTVPGLRHPVIHVNLRAHPELVPEVLACDVSSRIVGTNPPTGMMAPDVIVEGYTEILDVLSWDVIFSTSPYLRYNIGLYASDTGDTSAFLGRYDWDSCVLAEDLTTTETGVDVTTTPLITTAADDFTPTWRIVVDGEVMTVTGCTGAGNPQTLTVTRATNGVIKTHLTGAVVELHPEDARYAGL